MEAIKFGHVWYILYSRKDLDRIGFVVNRNMWIGDAWFFCVKCHRYTYSYAMSYPGRANCVTICRECDTHACDPAYPLNSPDENDAYLDYVKNFPTIDPRD